MKKSKVKISDYPKFLIEVKERIRSAQYEALRSANKELIVLYWDIGKMIDSRQTKGSWGKSIVFKLSADLKLEFPGVQGFSSQNLWYMRQFYLEYKNNPKLQPMVGEISWTKHLIIMSRCKDNLEREFYIRMTRRMGWTKNVLIHQIDNNSYEKTLLNQTNFNKALPPKIQHQAKLAVKDEYTFDFLELGEEHSEHELERSIMTHMNRFLIEMGGAFTFVGNQYRLEIGGKEFFIDILLYHRRLKALVAIELKVSEFKPEFTGQMQFYLAALDERVKQKEENASIGIILCKDKNRTVVEYSLKASNKPIGIAQYNTYTTLPKKLKKELPGPEQVGKLLEILN